MCTTLARSCIYMNNAEPENFNKTELWNTNLSSFYQCRWQSKMVNSQKLVIHNSRETSNQGLQFNEEINNPNHFTIQKILYIIVRQHYIVGQHMHRRCPNIYSIHCIFAKISQLIFSTFAFVHYKKCNHASTSRYRIIKQRSQNEFAFKSHWNFITNLKYTRMRFRFLKETPL